jgi:hypothetical protein
MPQGQSTSSTQTSTAPANPEVTATLNTLMQGVRNQYAQGPKVFNQSLYSPAGATTQQGWNTALGTASNPNYMAGVNGALRDQADVASGKYLNETDPNYQAMIDRAANGTAADINAAMGADGAYGSNVHVSALADQIGALRTNAAVQERQMELQRQQQAISNLPGLYSAGQMPAATIGAVGAAQDANQNAILQGQNDLFRRQNDAGTDYLGRFFSMLGSGAQIGGSNTTTTSITPQAPYWQSLLGLGLAFA